MTSDRPTVAEIKARALASMPALARELAPDRGRVDGHRYWACNPTRSDRSPDSFCIDISGSTAGRWIEFAAGATAKEGEGGDVIDLVAYVQTGGVNFRSTAARGAAIAWLGLRVGLLQGSGRGGWRRPVMRSADDIAAAERAQAFEAQRRASEQASRAGRAAAWWLKSGRPCPGTPVELYLTRTRGIPMAALPKWPGAIRFLPELVDQDGIIHPPAMFCAMTATITQNAGAETDGKFRGEIRATHRTFLTADGRKDPDAKPVRRMWGDVAGSAIRLSSGGSPYSAEEAARRGETKCLVIAEAAEKGLPACILWPERRVWAAGTVGNMGLIAKRFGWPACASEIVLVRDVDADGSPADRAFDKAAQAWMDASQGRPVSVLEPIGAHDLDELWRQSAGAAA